MSADAVSVVVKKPSHTGSYGTHASDGDACFFHFAERCQRGESHATINDFAFMERDFRSDYVSLHRRNSPVVAASTADFEQVTACFAQSEAEWDLLFWPEMSQPEDLQPFFVPAAWVVGRDGKVVASPIRGDAIEDHLEQLQRD